MDPNWIIAIISIISVVSPTLASWLNNRCQLDLKKIEIFEKRKYEAIENFTQSAERYYHYTTTDNKTYFETSISNLFIYFSIPDYSLFNKLKECIDSNDYNKTQFAISQIVKFLSEQLRKE